MSQLDIGHAWQSSVSGTVGAVGAVVVVGDGAAGLVPPEHWHDTAYAQLHP